MLRLICRNRFFIQNFSLDSEKKLRGLYFVIMRSRSSHRPSTKRSTSFNSIFTYKKFLRHTVLSKIGLVCCVKFEAIWKSIVIDLGIYGHSTLIFLTQFLQMILITSGLVFSEIKSSWVQFIWYEEKKIENNDSNILLIYNLFNHAVI